MASDRCTSDTERECAKVGCTEPAHPGSYFCGPECETDVLERGVDAATEQGEKNVD